MNNIRVVGGIIGLLVFFAVERHVFLFCPQMTRAGDSRLTVGSEDGEHVSYQIGPRQSFSSSSLGYDLSFTTHNTLGQLGSCGVLSYLDSQLYAGVVQQAKCSGGCMAGPLNACEARGSIGHLLLIPANDEALTSMKRATLPSGAKFQLTGNQLTYLSGQIDGHAFDGRLGNTGYFLVESIERQ